jgi:hypothetical protein
VVGRQPEAAVVVEGHDPHVERVERVGGLLVEGL